MLTCAIHTIPCEHKHENRSTSGVSLGKGLFSELEYLERVTLQTLFPCEGIGRMQGMDVHVHREIIMQEKETAEVRPL